MLSDMFMRCHDKVAGQITGCVARPSGQLIELILRRPRDVEQIPTGFCRFTTSAVAVENLGAKFLFQSVKVTDHRGTMEPKRLCRRADGPCHHG